MKQIIAMVALLTATAAGLVITRTTAQAVDKTPVSESQYRTLLDQCQYANTSQLRAGCQAAVGHLYRIGAENPNLDCRTYSGIHVCGALALSPDERECVRKSVNGGLTYRRAEVECYAFS
ncbi:hypothetical protein [Streptosporangium sp. NPDC000396]|uniref:hypothetical protein n=1 Tax=Streptosporangium sp. NPDC000396 TaxID=3366185 RepID=UPI0036836665